MTPRQERFVEEYLIDLNATQAAIRAGYSPRSARNTASEIMAKPDIQAAIAEAKQERSERLEIDADYVLDRLVEVAERCLQHVRPALGRDGRPLRDEDGNALYRFDSQGANRALELIGRHVNVQAWRDRIKVEGEISLADRINAGLRRVSPIADADYEELPPPAGALPEPSTASKPDPGPET